MSAWIATDKHIGSLALYYATNILTIDTSQESVAMQDIANILKEENIRSVNYRYSEETPITECDLSVAVSLSHIDAHSLASSLDYQSCEHEEYYGSNAARILQEIREHAAGVVMSSLPIQGKWSI